jgi:hypothetical protein
MGRPWLGCVQETMTVVSDNRVTFGFDGGIIVTTNTITLISYMPLSFILERVAKTSQIFLRDTHILPKHGIFGPFTHTMTQFKILS